MEVDTSPMAQAIDHVAPGLRSPLSLFGWDEGLSRVANASPAEKLRFGYNLTAAAALAGADADDLVGLCETHPLAAPLLCAVRTCELAGAAPVRVSSLPFGMVADACLLAADAVGEPWTLDRDQWSLVVSRRRQRKMTPERALRHIEDARIAAVAIEVDRFTMALGDGRVVIAEAGGDTLRYSFNEYADSEMEWVENPAVLAGAVVGRRLLSTIAGESAGCALGEIQLSIGDQGLAICASALEVTVVEPPIGLETS